MLLLGQCVVYENSSSAPILRKGSKELHSTSNFFLRLSMVGSVNSAAISGLQAATLKLQTNANNIANASTVGFQKQHVTTSAGIYGVEVKVERVNGTASPVLQADNAEGALRPSEVDLLEESIEMGVNKRLYDANLMTLRVADNMLGALLDLKA